MKNQGCGMKRCLSVLLSVVMLISCICRPRAKAESIYLELTEEMKSFQGFSDPKLLSYIQDSVYCGATLAFENEDYVVEDVTVRYISQEYLVVDEVLDATARRRLTGEELGILGGMLAHDKVGAPDDIDHPADGAQEHGNGSLVHSGEVARGYQQIAQHEH